MSPRVTVETLDESMSHSETMDECMSHGATVDESMSHGSLAHVRVFEYESICSSRPTQWTGRGRPSSSLWMCSGSRTGHRNSRPRLAVASLMQAFLTMNTDRILPHWLRSNVLLSLKRSELKYMLTSYERMFLVTWCLSTDPAVHLDPQLCQLL